MKVANKINLSFLMKPIKMRSLGNTVRKVLDQTNAD